MILTSILITILSQQDHRVVEMALVSHLSHRVKMEEVGSLQVFLTTFLVSLKILTAPDKIMPKASRDLVGRMDFQTTSKAKKAQDDTKLIPILPLNHLQRRINSID